MKNQMKQIRTIALATGGVVAWLVLSTTTHAQSSDALIDKLVDKGILTVKEANDLREETDKNFNSAYSVKSGMPDWVTSFKINGDMRGRYEGFFYPDNEAQIVDRNRWRYRARLGFVANIKDNFEVGLRLTSSEAVGAVGGDPISSNTTMTSNGSKKFVFLDLAYGKWKAVDNSLWTATTTVGKMENPFVYSDMVFDADYTPEGLAQQFSFNVSELHTLKFNLGGFALSELVGSVSDAYMSGAQLRMDSKWTPKISTSAGLGVLAISGLEKLQTGEIAAIAATTAGKPSVPAQAGVPDQNKGNVRDYTIDLNGNYKPLGSNPAPIYHFNPITADVAATYLFESFPMYSGAFPVKVFADYIVNPAAHDNDQGYQVGITFGKSGKKGTWDFGYRWKVLEANAWYEEVVDSDFGAFYQTGRNAAGNLISTTDFSNNPSNFKSGYGAGTNVRGHVLKATYSPYDALTLGVTYYLTEVINAAPNTDRSPTGRVQMDAVLKF